MRQFIASLAATALTAVALTVCAALPAAAGASAIVGKVVTYDGKTPYDRTEVTWTGDPGEASRLEVSYVLTNAVLLRDATGPIRVSGTCVPLADGAAVCLVEGDGVDVRLAGGDGDDELRVVEQPDGALEIDGGDGDDVISLRDGTAWNSRLLGGAGDDVITGSPSGERIGGGPGSDRIDAGGGEDVVTEDEPPPYGADRIDGGDGDDTLVYTRPDPVRVDLGAGSGGRPEGEDRLRGVERVFGTAGDDVLIGDDGPNTFNRQVNGGSTGDVGFDRIDGRGGDDLFYGAHGLLTCGPGNDRIGDASEAAIVPGDCEGVAGWPEALRLDGQRLRMAFTRWRSWMTGACGELVTVRDTGAGPRPLARRLVRLRTGETRAIELPLTRPAPLLVRVSTQLVVCRGGRPHAAKGYVDSFLYAPFSVVPAEPLQPVVPFG